MNADSSPLFDHFPVIDAVDHQILMHRDVHFGGLFSVMLDYYRQERKGIQPEFSLSRIERLAALQEGFRENLAALFLAAHEIQQVADARDAYRKLRAIYEVKNAKTFHPRLMADLILSEEGEPEGEIAAIAAEKEKIVPSLLDLLRSEAFYDPLFPGYGQAPMLAVECLSRIGDKRAIISLFEALGQGDFFADDQIIKALKAIGMPARDFLLHVLKGRPLNEDNEKAVIALIAFKDDEEVARHCFDLLQEPDVQKDPCLPTYLILASAGLKDPVQRKTFEALAKDPHFFPLLSKDIKGIVHDWADHIQQV